MPDFCKRLEYLLMSSKTRPNQFGFMTAREDNIKPQKY